MEFLDVILGVIVFAVFIIFTWELIKSMLFEKLFNKTSIKDVKENINDALHETMFYKYDIMFRTPDCKAYNKFNVHIAIRMIKKSWQNSLEQSLTVRNGQYSSKSHIQTSRL